MALDCRYKRAQVLGTAARGRGLLQDSLGDAGDAGRTKGLGGQPQVLAHQIDGEHGGEVPGGHRLGLVVQLAGRGAGAEQLDALRHIEPGAFHGHHRLRDGTQV
ncbi:MAG: hypothetical protein F4Y56_00170 [Acidimicrobiaceae bacterium]|nr:hypothetical protein [Acidimicrobiaceae bacterium]